MRSRSSKVTALEYFAGGVPAGAIFKTRVEDLRYIASLYDQQRAQSILELAYIGLTAYFESFCKDQFGSLISIAPTLTKDLAKKGQDTTIDIALITNDPTELKHRIGFYLSEKFDFGTPQKVNSLFGALISITPFSAKELKNFDRILHDRNLLVHHGGTYTTSYLRQTRKTITDGQPVRAFWDGIAITPEKFAKDCDFVEGIAREMVIQCHKAVSSHIKVQGITMGVERRKAMNFLTWWD
ncbi:hypothetical protein [Lysobacter terrae]